MNPSSTRLGVSLDEVVEAFEAAQQRDGRADLARFLPAPSHPEYRDILRELVRVDLDYGWSRGRPTPLEEYGRRFPELLRDPDTLRAVVWEEYRQRRLAGDEPDAEDYVRRFGIDPLGDAPAADDPEEERTRAVSVVPLTGGPPVEDADRHTAVAEADEAPQHSGELWTERIEALGTGPHAGPGSAELFRVAHRADPAAAQRFAKAVTALPKVGDTFLGFELIGELGRGAFGCVFLAKQSSMADRLVALKVATELFGEKLTLARLQHTNIVPIYSVHRAGAFQALCMPYLGATTLADVFRALKGKRLPTSGKHFVSTLHGRKSSTQRSLAGGSEQRGEDRGQRTEDREDKAVGSSLSSVLCPLSSDVEIPPHPEHITAALEALERLSYAEAVLWMGARLADGLAHAHERGIVHRDLKPANVLLTDDGEPMLLDFNLSDDTQLRHSEAGARVGGTLPYMAPEHLRAFQTHCPAPVDGRSDLYSLGLILFELLTGHPAFPAATGTGHAALAQMLAERGVPPPRLRDHNPAITPAVEAIVRRCLEPDITRRYASALDLKEDIERHLAHLPLKHTPDPSPCERFAKWVRRHPRLTSGTSVGLAAAVLLVAVGWSAYGLSCRAERHDAEDLARQLIAETDTIYPDLVRTFDRNRANVLGQARAAVGRYHVFDRPDWPRQRAITVLPVEEQERLRTRLGDVLFLIGQGILDEGPKDPARVRQALECNDLVAACFAEERRPQAWWEQRARLLERLGEGQEAQRLLDQAREAPPHSTHDYYLRALHLVNEGRYREALEELKPATANDPKAFWALLLRGNCHLFLGQDAEAARFFSACISLDPQKAPPHFNLGKVWRQQGNYPLAIAEYERGIQIDPDRTDARIDLAMARVQQALYQIRPGHPDLAAAELQRAARPVTLPEGVGSQLQSAEEELTAILGGDGAPVRAWFHRAYVRRLVGDKAGADADVKEGLAREPDEKDFVSWVVRGVHWKNNRQPERALADFRRAEQINPYYYPALDNQAEVLSEMLHQPETALEVLNRLLGRYPDLPHALAGRAVLLARAGKVADAVRDADRVLQLDNRPFTLYQVAGVYALTADRPGHLHKALNLLSQALRAGAGYSEIGSDPDLNRIRQRPEFRRLYEAVQTLQSYRVE